MSLWACHYASVETLSPFWVLQAKLPVFKYMSWVLPTSHLPPFLFALPISILYIYYPSFSASSFELSHPIVQLPSSSALPESSELSGAPHCATSTAHNQDLHMGGSMVSVCTVHLSPSSFAAFFPVFSFASPPMPGAMSSVSAFCFPQKTMIYFLLLFLQPSFPKFLCIFSSGTTPSHSISSVLLLGWNCLHYLFGLTPLGWIRWFWALFSLVQCNSGS